MARRKHIEAPVSLFSFQDIVVCIVGIMLLVAMKLALDLVKNLASSPPAATASVVKTPKSTVDAMEQEVEKLRKKVNQAAHRLDEAVSLDLNEMRRRLPAARHEQATLQEALKDLRRQQTDAARRLQQARAEQPAADEIQRRLAEINEEIERLTWKTKKIEGNPDRVIYNQSPGDPKEAYLVELSGAGYAVARAGLNESSRVFADRAALMAWCGGLNPSQHYLVILVKPSGVNQFNGLRDELAKRRFEIGYDLLPERVTALGPARGVNAP